MTPDREAQYETQGPLDVRRTLRGLVHGRSDPTGRVEPDGSVWRATHTPDGPATFQALPAEAGSVVLRAWGPGAAALIERGRDLLGLHDDPTALVPRHPLVRDLARRHEGSRLTRGMSVRELLLPTILGQRVAGKEGEMSWRGLVAALGEPAPGPLELLLPPTSVSVRRLPLYAFFRFGVEAKRAHTLQEVCRVPKHVEAVAELPPEKAVERLCLIRGVGPWTATIAVAKALGWADAVPLGDDNLPHMVAFALAGEERADDQRMLQLLEPYAGQRWRVLNLLKSSGIHAPRRGPRHALRTDHLAYDAHGRPRSKGRWS